MAYNFYMQLTDSSLVLIAIMPKARDMEIARVLGWYRIPMKTAPKILNVDLIAFYQTADFGKGHKSRIEHYAEVRGVELTTRRELLRDQPEHPRASEEYYKLQLGALTPLPQPILADHWKRFLFFYTTGEKIFKANTISDLAVTGAERDLLWRSLRERQEKPLEAERCTVMDLPHELLFLLGNLTLSPLEFNGGNYG